MNPEFDLSPDVKDKLEEVMARFIKVADDGSFSVEDSLTVENIELEGKVDNLFRTSPSVKPEDFLENKEWIPEVGALTHEPDMSFVRALLRRPSQTALFLIGACWYVAAGQEEEFPAWLFPKSEVSIHSHVQGTEVDFLPDLKDFVTPTRSEKSFIVSNLGITRFWPIRQIDINRLVGDIQWEITSKRFPDSYDQFLEKMGVKFEVHPWRHLTYEGFKEVICAPTD